MKKIFFLIVISVIFIYGCKNKVETISAYVEDNSVKPVAKNANAMIEKDDTKVFENRVDRIFKDLPVDKSNNITIQESQFMTQIDNIKRNIDEYKNKKITVEGMLGYYEEWDGSFKSYLVYRNGPNDYNNDIFAGFFMSDINIDEMMIDDWIRVIGTPYIVENYDSENVLRKYLFIKVEKLQVLDNSERGLELVNN